MSYLLIIYDSLSNEDIFNTIPLTESLTLYNTSKAMRNIIDNRGITLSICINFISKNFSYLSQVAVDKIFELNEIHNIGEINLDRLHIDYAELTKLITIIEVNTKTLQKITINSARLNTEKMKNIADSLSKCEKLTEITLYDALIYKDSNFKRDPDFKEFMQKLSNCKELRILNLNSNNMNNEDIAQISLPLCKVIIDGEIRLKHY